MKNKAFLVSLLCILVAGLLLAACAPAPAPAPKPTQSPSPAPAAETAAEFYKKSTVTLVCPSAPGAGSDYAARLIASYWTDATDGGAMIVKNVSGGNALAGGNLIGTAKSDGLTLGLVMLSSSYVGPMSLKDPGLKVDPLKQTWIGGVFGEPNTTCLAIGLPYKTVKDLRGVKGLKFSTTSANTGTTICSALLAEFLGLENFSIVSGYGGGAEMILALGKKEIDGFTSPYSSTVSAIDKGFATKPPIVIFTPKRDALLPDTPSIYELVDMTPEREALYKAGMAISNSLRTVSGPPDIAADKVKFVRDAFVKITAMKGFQDQAKFFFPIWTEPMSGDEILEYIKQSQTLPTDKVTTLIKKYLASK